MRISSSSSVSGGRHDIRRVADTQAFYRIDSQNCDQQRDLTTLPSLTTMRVALFHERDGQVGKPALRKATSWQLVATDLA
jgi:hypothetical protein